MAALLASCGSDSSPSSSIDAPDSTVARRKVAVVGAGPAGMTAAYRLRKAGVDVEVLEAAPTHGGRIKHDLEFADFPISLGGEWVHVDGSILDEVVDDPRVDVTTELVPYQPDDEFAFVEEGAVQFAPLVPEIFDVDTKFRGSSWLDFFDSFVVPSIRDTFRFDTQVVEVDHSGDRVRLRDAQGDVHEADDVIFTVPLKMLQLREVTFVPDLEADRWDDIDRARVWSGLKAFFVFDEKFYPAAIAHEDSETEDGQRIYYDAAYGQPTDQNVLGLFSVGAQAEAFQALADDDFVAAVLEELDEAFDGAATRSYVRHLVQNWNDEPFARAAYLEDNAPTSITKRLAEPLSDRVLFAGDAYTSFPDWSSVHTAARSAIEAVDHLIG